MEIDPQSYELVLTPTEIAYCCAVCSVEMKHAGINNQNVVLVDAGQCQSPIHSSLVIPRRICLICGKRVTHGSHTGRTYCSQKCISAAKKGKRREKVDQRWWAKRHDFGIGKKRNKKTPLVSKAPAIILVRSPSVSKSCVICGKTFNPRPDNAGKCCSSACALEYSRRQGNSHFFAVQVSTPADALF